MVMMLLDCTEQSWASFQLQTGAVGGRAGTGLSAKGAGEKRERMEMKVVSTEAAQGPKASGKPIQTTGEQPGGAAPGIGGVIYQKAVQTSVAGADAGPRTLCLQRVGGGGNFFE